MIISSLLFTRPVVDASNSLDSGGSGSCNPNSSRTALDILWSCLGVLFACTWVSVHPNVPGPKEGSARRLWTKLKLMIITLIAPELMILWAARQWFAARRLVRGYQGWTTTHALFALMGGFALYEGNQHVSVIRFLPYEALWGKNKADILNSLNESSSMSVPLSVPNLGYTTIMPTEVVNAENSFHDYSFAAHANFIRKVKKEEIKDRSQTDGFAKLIAIGQTAWFVVQLCARWATSLPVTELEIMTLAFAVMNLPIYFFWWNKPQGVGFSIRIQKGSQNFDEETDEQYFSPPSPTSRATVWLQWVPTTLCTGLLSFFRRLFEEVHELYMKKLTGNTYKEIGILLKLFYIFTWWLLAPIVAIFKVSLEKLFHTDVALFSEKVGSFEPLNELEPRNSADRLIGYMAAMIFGSIHCIAWGSQFPSDQEKILWRVCSILVTFLPIYLVLVTVDIGLPRWLGDIFLIISFVLVLVYILARLSLIVQVFLALRALPPGTLNAVQWTNFLPHI